MHKLIFIFLMFLATLAIQANEVDYQNKQLRKELLNTWNVDIEAMSEMPELSKQTINEGKFFKVLNQQEIIGYVYVGRILSCREGGCCNDKTQPISSSYEYFDAYFIYDANKTLEKVKVFNYRATHGQEICSKGWLKQFIGFGSEKPLEVGKSIDGISGATISVYALTDEVNYISQLLKSS